MGSGTEELGVMSKGGGEEKAAGPARRGDAWKKRGRGGGAFLGSERSTLYAGRKMEKKERAYLEAVEKEGKKKSDLHKSLRGQIFQITRKGL